MKIEGNPQYAFRQIGRFGCFEALKSMIRSNRDIIELVTILYPIWDEEGKPHTDLLYTRECGYWYDLPNDAALTEMEQLMCADHIVNFYSSKQITDWGAGGAEYHWVTKDLYLEMGKEAQQLIDLSKDFHLIIPRVDR